RCVVYVGACTRSSGSLLWNRTPGRPMYTPEEGITMFRGVKSRAIGLLALGLMIPLLAACDVGSPAAQKPNVTIASKAFTEETLVGEMYSQLLEAAGYPVTRKLNLGETSVLQPALEKGDIQIYPEYTGTGLTVVLQLPPSSDAKQVY